MSLFPAYAPPGSSGSGSGRRQDKQNRRNSKGNDGNQRNEDRSAPLFVIDRKGGGERRGDVEDPSIITIDCADSSDGELPSSGSPSEETQLQSARSKPSSSTSSAKKKQKNKKSRKRKRSRSPKKNKKRRRSSSVEEVDRSYNEKVYEKKRDYDSRGDYNNRDRYDDGNRGTSSNRYNNNRDRSYDDRGRGGGRNYDYDGGRGGGRNYDYDGGRNGDRNFNNDRGRGGGGRDYNSGGGRGGGRDDYYNNQFGYQQQQERGREDRGGHQFYEDQRVRTAERFPKKVFLEEVNLKPEYAFRLDTERVQRNLQFHSLSNFQKSYYEHGGGKVFGATDQELMQIYSKFSKFRCILPQEIDDDGNPIDDNSSSVQGINKNSSSSELSFKIDKRGEGSRPSSGIPCETFISIGKEPKEGERDRYDGRNDTKGDGFESLSIPRKEGELSLKQKIEKYNADLRQDPRNVNLWKEFVAFQDQVFEEAGQIYNFEGDANEQSGSSNQRGPKKKRNRKALIEKKVAILDKALGSSPKNLDLHLLRLELLYEIRKPGFVLTEWKKLVANNQQVSPFWIEYLRFASTQLQIYTSTSLTSLFEKCFQKFRQMINPSFAENQRPQKCALIMGDLLLAFTLILKNAGYREKAIALQQAQLEIDFFCPSELLQDETLVQWKDDRQLFDIFWDIGTPTFGEPGANGWTDVVVNKNVPEKSVIGVPESKISEFEDLFFETINEDKDSMSDDMKKQKHWLTIESTRSKMYWIPWRASCSDAEDVEDAQRVVLAADVSPFVSPVPILPYISAFDRQSTFFRHTVNFLVSLQEDFIPQTQTLDSVLSAFSALSLTESRSLFSEVFYWKKLLSLYAISSTTTESSLNVPKEFLKTPEGFRVMDLTSANPINPGDPTKIHLTEYPPKVEESKSNILRLNHTNHMSMIRSVVDKAIEHLEAPFSSIIFEMYLRFEQKNTFATQENRKARMKHAKNLMKKEKLRNAMSCYKEMALLEFFEGNTTAAIDLLVKIINVGCTTLSFDESDNIDLEKDWEVFTELTMLYRTLAELYIRTNQPMAYNVLALLGNGFKPVKTDLTEEELTMKTNVMLKALRQFEKIFAQLLPGVELEEVTEESPILEEALSKWDGDKSVEYLVQKSNLIVEWTRVYALFQFFAKDFDAASQVFEKALGKIKAPKSLGRSSNYDENLVNRHNMREQLYISWCNLGALTLSKNPLINAKFRNILGMALQEYPSSPPLLLLFTDVENQMSIAGKLWRMMVLVVKQDGGCNHWAPLFMGMGLAKKIEDLEHDEEIGLDSFGLGGPAVPPDTIFYKLDTLLTAGQQNSMTRNCPLIWRIHLKLLALRAQVGKDVKRAVATFYDAVRHCPSAKALYLDGITYFPQMFKEITDLMGEKQLYIRLPIEELEVLLDIENEGKQSGKPKDDRSSSPDCEVISDGEV